MVSFEAVPWRSLSCSVSASVYSSLLIPRTPPSSLYSPPIRCACIIVELFRRKG